jgi:hypothetical protein
MPPWNVPIPRARQPQFGEGSALASNRDDRNNSRLWSKAKTGAQQNEDFGRVLEGLNRQIQQLKKRIPGGYVPSAGIPWQQPYRELDTTVSVSKGTWVYISPENTIVTAGLIDLVAGINIKSVPGIWEAKQDVPSAVGGHYNVPQPLAQAVPSGSPLKGDMDAAGLFWVPISPALVCH